jgi:thioredoxin 1
MEDWNERQLNDVIQGKETFCLYLYTPLCGTCQVASRMLSITLELLPNWKCGQMNLNYFPNLASQYELESVPCLLVFKEGQFSQKLYAFQSVSFLYDLLKKEA